MIDRQDDLLCRALEAFSVAHTMRVNRAEGIAILMASGQILTGYSQTSAMNSDAASDALRLILPNLPEEGEKPKKSRIPPHFLITAFALVVENNKGKVDPRTIARLESYPYQAADVTGVCAIYSGQSHDPFRQIGILSLTA